MKPEQIKPFRDDFGGTLKEHIRRTTNLKEVQEYALDKIMEKFDIVTERMSQALLKVDGDLVKVIRQYFVDNDCKATNAFEEGLAKAIAPHLQAAADKEREIERLKEDIERLDSELSRMEMKVAESVSPDEAREAVQQERERAVSIVDKYLKDGHYKALWEFPDGGNQEVNCWSGDVEYVWKQLRQALEGKHDKEIPER